MKEFLKDYLKATGKGLGKLIKALVISSLINFLVLLIGLYIIDIPYFALVALAIALVDLLPVLGAGMVLVPWAIIVFFMGNVNLAISLVVLFVITFVIKQLTEPLILGKSVGLNPFFTIIITIGSMLILSPGIGAIVGSVASMLIGSFLEVKSAYKEIEEKDEDKNDEKDLT